MTTNIGVSASFFYPDPNRAVYHTKSLSYFENELARYLFTHRTLPCLIPDLGDANLAKFCQEMAGLVLQGGVDIAPETYNEKPTQWPGDSYRDEYELELIKIFRSLKRPIFGICRGAQLLNCHFGGTLHQDLTGSIPHRNAKIYDRLSHEIQLQKDGLLEKIYGTTHGVVNTVHHQGIKDLGQGLSIEASAPDGLIEAFSHSNMKENWVLGVQWHPEFSKALSNVLDPKPLLDLFVGACIGNKP